jgi:hypothetical protein
MENEDVDSMMIETAHRTVCFRGSRLRLSNSLQQYGDLSKWTVRRDTACELLNAVSYAVAVELHGELQSVRGQ